MGNYANVNKNVFNDAYLPFFQSRHRYQHLMGGGGSGKSVAVAQKICFKYLLPYKTKDQWYKAQLSKYPKHELDRLIHMGKLKPTNIRPHKEKIVLLRSQQNLVRDSQFQEIKSIIIKYNLDVDINESAMRMKASNGNEIISAGLRSGGAERLKSISGVTRFWVEEATDGGITIDDIDQLDTRMRNPYCKDSCIIMTYNPVHEDHWINQYYWQQKIINTDKQLPQSVIDRFSRTLFKVKTTYKDNKFLPQDYIEQLLSKEETNPNYYRVYALGEWGGSPEGCIYKNWTKVGAFPDACDKYVYGIDKGMNHPYAIVKCAFLPVDIYKTEIINGTPHQIIVASKGIYVQEVAYERGLTTNEMITKYERSLDKNLQCYMSPEAASDKKDFRMSGFNIADANNDVKNGIAFLQDFCIHIVSNDTHKSQNIVSEIQNYKYQKNNQTGTYTDVPDKKYDDAMDAMRYGIYTGFKSSKYKAINMVVT